MRTTGPASPVNDDSPAATTNGTPNPIDTHRPHPARRYNALLGGKDNFAADRESADQLAQVFPSIATAAVENRRFLQRLVGFLAAEAGIRQFLRLKLVDPGLVSIVDWRPEQQPNPGASARDTAVYGAVAQLP